jgi:hypothetical protein
MLGKNPWPEYDSPSHLSIRPAVRCCAAFLLSLAMQSRLDISNGRWIWACHGCASSARFIIVKTRGYTPLHLVYMLLHLRHYYISVLLASSNLMFRMGPPISCAWWCMSSIGSVQSCTRCLWNVNLFPALYKVETYFSTPLSLKSCMLKIVPNSFSSLSHKMFFFGCIS